MRHQPELTLDDLGIFVGGQAEIQNQVEKYLYRGTLKAASVEDGNLKLTFEWLAKGEGYPGSFAWVPHSETNYEASLDLFTVQDIGPGQKGSARLFFTSFVTNEMVLLLPPDSSRLERPAPLPPNETPKSTSESPSVP